ncbi:MAG: M23 family metallopeptidase, partial [Spirochaetaceae bacterium]|nr:M23 family metallopeptidase [Spirochaetaceae bacterium]
FHGGLDIAAPTGTKIRATAIGIVAEAGTSPDLGNYVVISHLFGISSVYGHLSRIEARKGSLALPGIGSIGAVGSTGRSTGPHLHFAIRSGSSGLPPRPLLVFHTMRRAILGF